METPETYTEAARELEQILATLEAGQDTDMDAIAARVKRAAELIAFYRSKLHRLDEELQQIVDAE